MGQKEKNKVYSDEELVYLYREKIKRDKKIPTPREINEDPELPFYSTFYRKIGGEKEIWEKVDIKKDYDKLNSRLCLDCVHDPRACNRVYKDCKKEAKLYFRMLNNKN